MEDRIHFNYDEKVVEKRIALRKLKNVQDPECLKEMCFSPLKSSRLFDFDSSFLTVKQKNDHNGYSTARTTRGLKENGRYYWEIDFLNAQTGACRLGITTIAAKINAPTGYDEFGYSLRSKGSVFHMTKKSPGPSFKVGDTVGFGLLIDDENITLYASINGGDSQVLFSDIKRDEWFPSVSLYRDAVVQARFSAPFKYQPEGWTPAGSHVKIEPKEKYTQKDIFRCLKGNIRDLNQEIIFIINDAIAFPDPAEL